MKYLKLKLSKFDIYKFVDSLIDTDIVHVNYSNDTYFLENYDVYNYFIEYWILGKTDKSLISDYYCDKLEPERFESKKELVFWLHDRILNDIHFILYNKSSPDNNKEK